MRRPGEKDVELREVVIVCCIRREEVIGRERLAVKSTVVCCQATEGARVLIGVRYPSTIHTRSSMLTMLS